MALSPSLKASAPPLAAGGSATWQQVHPAQGLHLPSGQPTGVEARAAAVPAGEERNGRMSPPTGPGRDAGGAGSRWAEPKHARGGAAPCGRAFSWRSIAPRQGRGGPAARPGPREGSSNARAALRTVGREEGGRGIAEQTNVLHEVGKRAHQRPRRRSSCQAETDALLRGSPPKSSEVAGPASQNWAPQRKRGRWDHEMREAGAAFN